MRLDTFLPQVTRLWFEIKDKMTEELSQDRIWFSRHEGVFETIDTSPVLWQVRRTIYNVQGVTHSIGVSKPSVLPRRSVNLQMNE
jgi:hypothetical protein